MRVSPGQALAILSIFGDRELKGQLLSFVFSPRPTPEEANVIGREIARVTGTIWEDIKDDRT